MTPFAIKSYIFERPSEITSAASDYEKSRKPPLRDELRLEPFRLSLMDLRERPSSCRAPALDGRREGQDYLPGGAQKKTNHAGRT